MTSKKHTKNIETVLGVLRDEIEGNVMHALENLDANYTMTWMYQAPKKKELFPSTKKTTREELSEVYHIKGRKYDIKNIADNGDTVFIEMIESYPDPKTNKVYRTPQVIVLEMKDGKIKTGRHYCDPNLSYEYLSEKDIRQAYK